MFKGFICVENFLVILILELHGKGDNCHQLTKIPHRNAAYMVALHVGGSQTLYVNQWLTVDSRHATTKHGTNTLNSLLRVSKAFRLTHLPPEMCLAIVWLKAAASN